MVIPQGQSHKDSPFKDLLKTNYVASDNERRQITNIITEQCESIAQIDAEVNRLRASLTALLREREEVEESLLGHRGISSPNRRVPREIWGEIFVQCLSDVQFASIDIHKPPLVLGRVCKTWRSISLSMPKLWVSLWLQYTADRPSASRIRGIQSWLARSDDLPLHIRLTEEGWGSYPESDYSYTSLLLPYAARIKSFAGGMTYQTANLVLKHDGLSALVNVDIDVDLRDDQILEISPSATCLRSLTLKGDIDGMSFKFPWSQLNEFNALFYVDINNCFDIFAQCPQVSKLSLGKVGGKADRRNRPHVIMPYLTSLTIVTESDIVSLWNNLTVPQLREASFTCGDTTWPQSELFDFIDRSSCPLRKLYIDQDPHIPDADMLLACAQRITTVEQLTTGLVRDGKSIVTRMPERVSRLLALRRAGPQIEL